MKLSLLNKLRLYRLTQNKAMIEKLKSRKLWATVIAAALATLGGQLGVSQDLIENIVQLVMAYVIGQGIADSRKPEIIQ